ncbi:hypothetical protein ACQR1W_31555 [Bradyrhizobium sp. HKCCYLS1011]|uniref:hypothetical protein n=1 Tax=Bradyrhizobium sp. HKCCYLS1011 TaxID=3420733 RepID=UPI003EBBB60C
MALLARKSTGVIWDSVTDQTPEDLDFPADVLADLLEGGNEISVWEVADRDGPEMDRVAAALHSPNAQNLSEMTFRFISEWRLNNLGLEKNKEVGTTVDTVLNKAGKHWVIKITKIGDAIKLAKALKDPNQPVRFYSREQVMRCFAESLEAKRIGTEKITTGLWQKLLNEGHLQVVAAPPIVTPSGDRAESSPAPPTESAENKP